MKILFRYFFSSVAICLYPNDYNWLISNISSVRPPLNKKSFPVDRPGGIILRLYPAAFFFFFFFFKLKYFSHFSVFTIVYRMIRRLHKKKNTSEKKVFPGRPGGFILRHPAHRKMYPQNELFSIAAHRYVPKTRPKKVESLQIVDLA